MSRTAVVAVLMATPSLVNHPLAATFVAFLAWVAAFRAFLPLVIAFAAFHPLASKATRILP